MLRFQRAQSGRPVGLLCDCGKKRHHNGRSRRQRRLLLTQEAGKREWQEKAGVRTKICLLRCTSNDLLSPVKSHLQKFLPPPNADIQLRTNQRWIQWWNQSLYDSIALPKPHLWKCYIRDQDSSTGGFRGIILYPNYDRIEKGRQQGSLTTPGVNLGPGWFESREPSSHPHRLVTCLGKVPRHGWVFDYATLNPVQNFLSQPQFVGPSIIRWRWNNQDKIRTGSEPHPHPHSMPLTAIVQIIPTSSSSRSVYGWVGTVGGYKLQMDSSCFIATFRDNWKTVGREVVPMAESLDRMPSFAWTAKSDLRYTEIKAPLLGYFRLTFLHFNDQCILPDHPLTWWALW